MIRSMTGFGRCETVINGREITVEIKSVNHRYFEFSCRTPKGYGFLDDKLKALVNSRVSRGKIDMFVTVGAAEDTPAEVKINHSLVSGYINAMKEISETYGIENDVTVTAISRFPDVYTVSKAPENEEEITADVLEAANTAIDGFIAMREAEGEKVLVIINPSDKEQSFPYSAELKVALYTIGGKAESKDGTITIPAQSAGFYHI